MTVEYRDIQDFPGYRVGSDGTVWSRRKAVSWKNLTACFNRTKHSNGYLFVCLCRDGKKHNRFVHRLILEVFVGPCPEGMEARHFPDPSHENCQLSNLLWGTPTENAADMIAHGTMPRGERQGLAKLSRQVVCEILSRHNAGETQVSLAERFGVHQGTIWRIVSGKTWRHVNADSLSASGR